MYTFFYAILFRGQHEQFAAPLNVFLLAYDFFLLLMYFHRAKPSRYPFHQRGFFVPIQQKYAR